MKKILYLIFILYLGIFIALGFFLYRNQLKNFFTSSAKTLERQTVSSTAAIYYGEKNTLYRFQEKSASAADIKNFPFPGEIVNLAINQEGNQAVIGLKTADLEEIYLTNTSNFYGRKFAAKDMADFGGFNNFSKAQFSPDGGKLAFLGHAPGGDVIFQKNLTNNLLKKLTPPEAIQISDFAWDKESSKIVYCSSNSAGCWQAEVLSETSQPIFVSEVASVSWPSNNLIIYLSRGSETSHLFALKIAEQTSFQLDNLSGSKKITSFQVDPSGAKVTYVVQDDGQSDIYLSNIDGTNRWQLTKDGKSLQAVFSPSAKKIAILKTDGLYINEINKNKETKMVNLSQGVQLLLWR